MNAPVVDWLLSSLARRLYASLDLGLLTLLEAPPDQYELFVDRHLADPVRGLTYVLGLAVAERPAPPPEPLRGVVTWSERFVGAAHGLADFRAMRPDELRRAAGEFGQAWLELRQCLEDLAAALGVEPAFTRALGDDRERGYRDRVRRLFDDLEAERTGPA
jgi:hypothetical protein